MFILKNEYGMYSIGGSNVTTSAIAKLFTNVDQFNTFNAFIHSMDESTAKKMAEVLKRIRLEFDHDAILASFESDPINPETYAELVLDKFYPKKIEDEYCRLTSQISDAQYEPVQKAIDKLIEESKSADEYIINIKTLLTSYSDRPFEWTAENFCHAIERNLTSLTRNRFYTKHFSHKELNNLAKQKVISQIFRVYDFEKNVMAPVPEDMATRRDALRTEMEKYHIDWYSIDDGSHYEDDENDYSFKKYVISVLDNGVNSIF